MNFVKRNKVSVVKGTIGNDMRWIRRISKIFVYAVYLTIFVMILLEIIFRILPTSDSLLVKPVNKQNKIVRYTENRSVKKQIGFTFSHVNVRQTNNYGFVSDKNFEMTASRNRPVIAVIGDSYVEALQVKYQDTFHFKLDKKLKKYDVYPIGISGSALSQYIAFAKFAKNEFRPDLYIFLIIENDFRESTYNAANSPGFNYFDKNGELKLIEYSPSMLKRIFRRSAFLRFLHLDLNVLAQASRIFEGHNISDYSSLSVDDNFLPEGNFAIDTFLAEVNQLTETASVVLLLDGDRRSIYRGEPKRDSTKPRIILYDELIKKSKRMNRIEIIDLQDYFQRDWAINKKPFNYNYDYHWNEYGHTIAANALLKEIERILK